MGQLDRRISELERVQTGLYSSDEDLCRYLASVTPDHLREHVIATDWLDLVEMIRKYVPGYGPH